jgi:hypothetical protein
MKRMKRTRGARHEAITLRALRLRCPPKRNERRSDVFEPRFPTRIECPGAIDRESGSHYVDKEKFEHDKDRNERRSRGFFADKPRSVGDKERIERPFLASFARSGTNVDERPRFVRESDGYVGPMPRNEPRSPGYEARTCANAIRTSADGSRETKKRGS